MNCGQISDGCSATLDCGTCAAPDTCGGGAVSNVCGHGGYSLPADRATAWGLAGMQSVGGVPSANWPICNATPLSPSGGDDSIPINKAIQGCAAGTVVQLAAGTFLMGRGNFVLVNKGVVLRGAGAGLTILRNPANDFLKKPDGGAPSPDSTPVIIVGPRRWTASDKDPSCGGLTPYDTTVMQLLSSDGLKGQTSVQVADGAIFSAGMLVKLDENTTSAWQPDVEGSSTSILASADYATTWRIHNPAVAGEDTVTSGVTPTPANNYSTTGTGKDEACWFSRQDRFQNEIKEIASVAGNVVTFNSPLHKTYRTGHYAELTTYTGNNLPVKNAGIEKMTFVGGGDACVRFNNTAYSWAKNIEVMHWNGEGIALSHSFRDEVRDSYVHNADFPENGGGAYAISLQMGSSEILVENNISMQINKVIVARASGAGSVFAYNYMDVGYIADNELWIEDGINASHLMGPHHVLMEGNWGVNIDSDFTHGNSTYNTHFRNYVTTIRSAFTNTYTGDQVDDAAHLTSDFPKRAVGANQYTYWMSYVGNVLGAPGIATAANGYIDEDMADSWKKPAGTIWLMGYGGTHYNPNAASTAIRDGNWDTLLGQQTWLTTAAAPLPASLYLPTKPAFFGSNPWPWVDPATGNVQTLPAKARYDAGTPNVLP